MPDHTFAALFDAAPETRADAPGRVNLIGEHTDYHEGFVLPCPIPQRTFVEARSRQDSRVRLWSEDAGAEIVEFEVGNETRGRGWIDYIQGLTWVLGERGHRVSGFDARISSAVPVGAGLSSSAALEVSMLRALRDLFELDLDDLSVARIAQRAEVDFVGAPVGIMDQMAASVGRDGGALFIDTRSLDYERLPLPASVELVVIDSGITHAHAEGKYPERRRESFDAAALLGVAFLRDVPESAMDRIARLPPTAARRARHIVSENGRVLDAVEAVRTADAARLGTLFNASHASMRDDYEISLPHIDLLVTAAQQDSDVFGARLTGGGFGGSVVILSRANTGSRVATRILNKYAALTGRRGAQLLPTSPISS